jgi:hypothetical protein
VSGFHNNGDSFGFQKGIGNWALGIDHLIAGVYTTSFSRRRAGGISHTGSPESYCCLPGALSGNPQLASTIAPVKPACKEKNVTSFTLKRSQNSTKEVTS